MNVPAHKHESVKIEIICIRKTTEGSVYCYKKLNCFDRRQHNTKSFTKESQKPMKKVQELIESVRFLSGFVFQNHLANFLKLLQIV